MPPRFTTSSMKQVKKAKSDSGLKYAHPDAFAFAIAACRGKGGEPTGNFEAVIKTPKSKQDAMLEVREKINTEVLEERITDYSQEWGGCHFRIHTSKQADLIVEALKTVSFGDQLNVTPYPQSFMEKAAPVLRITYDPEKEWHILSEKAYNLKFYLGLLGFCWQRGT